MSSARSSHTPSSPKDMASPSWERRSAQHLWRPKLTYTVLLPCPTGFVLPVILKPPPLTHRVSDSAFVPSSVLRLLQFLLHLPPVVRAYCCSRNILTVTCCIL